MSGFTAFVETVRNKWRAVRCLAVARPEIRSSAGVRTSQGVDVSRQVFEPAAGGAGSPQRIDRMMQAFGVDSQELQRDYPRVLRDASLTCLHCKSKRRCLRELEAGTAVANAELFCPNADLFAIFADGPEGRG